MKILLGLSLILNVILGVLYFQEKNQPPIERIIMEHSAFKETSKKIIVEDQNKIPHAKAAMMVNTQDANTEVSSTSVQDEQTFAIASEEIDRAKNTVLEDLEISEELIKRKEKITNAYYEKSAALYKKNPYGPGQNFQDRRKLIELEEKLHQDYAKLLGKKKWEQYRKFVDDYNQKLLKNHKSTEFSQIMMGY